MPATVAIVKCSTYSQPHVDQAVSELLDLLGGISRYVKSGDRVLLKPNLLGASHPDDPTSTHRAVIHSLIQQVQSVGGKPFIGDAPAFGNVTTVARKSGLMAVAEELGVGITDWSDSVRVPHPANYSLKFYTLAREVVEADVVINVPKLKVHQQMQLTGAIKNNFGCVPGKRKARLHLWRGKDRVTFGKMLIEYCELIKPALTVVDAIVAMDRVGPRNGNPYPLGILTGGVDVVALDRVHGEIVGLPDDAFDLMNAAREIGIGETDLTQIKILGERLVDVQVSDFKFPLMMPVNFSPFRIVKSTIKHLWAKRVA
ncbi:DUF362 domain-containing protein [Candidatus Poribacteria bacterium]|nr:DUF362 domain-containing protein [Candidatus Poribacteria bacterium]